MDDTSLSIAFGNSLKDEVASGISNLAEVGLDAIMDEGIFKDIPILSTAIAIYKIGSSIKERHNMKKLIVFLNEINKQIVSEERRSEYQQKFQGNEKFRNQEIEYLLVLIDSYISYDKPQMLAKLYLAYLDEKIDWNLFSTYATAIDNLLPGDYECIISFDSEISVLEREMGNESYIRLNSLGMISEKFDKTGLVEDGNGGYAMTYKALQRSQSEEKTYILTDFGEKFIDILKN